MAFLPYIDVALDVLQTPRALRRAAAAELVGDWHGDGVVHGEVRFAPQLHARAGMTVDEAVDAVASGAREASARLGISTSLILCLLRHQSLDVALEVADAAVRHQDVSGLDLAGDERLPGQPFVAAFDLAHAAGLAVTVHAGEGAGPESVWEAIDVLGARRVGHGVRRRPTRSWYGAWLWTASRWRPVRVATSSPEPSPPWLITGGPPARRRGAGHGQHRHPHHGGLDPGTGVRRARDLLRVGLGRARRRPGARSPGCLPTDERVTAGGRAGPRDGRPIRRSSSPGRRTRR